MRTHRLPTLVAVLLLGACAGTRPPVAAPEPAPRSRVEQARLDSLKYPYTEADVAFMQGMIMHHSQAVLISQWAPTHGASQQILRLSARIINAQQDEIALMRNWLTDRNRTVEGEHAAHAGHEGMGAMPGMLSPAQLTELDAARGEAFDMLFLKFMILHHRGAVTMVTDLLASKGSSQDETVFRFASDVQVDQTTEIRRMLQMLLELGGEPPE